ncbi:MAG: DUF1501 domain-containing protein [Pseudomonadota bacterium]
MVSINRRRFLSGAGALGFSGAASRLMGLSAGKAFAADTSGYKALVCIFLKGGLDHADLIIPVDQSSYDLLVNTRAGLMNNYGVGSGTSTRDRANLLTLNADNIGDYGGRAFGVAQDVAPLHTLFEDGDLAFVGNVGPLITPTDRTSYEDLLVPVPAQLFSHNDQQSTWMSLGTEGERIGWGGRFADQILQSDPAANENALAVTVSSLDVFLSGQNVRQFRASSNLRGEPSIISNRGIIGGNRRYDMAREEIAAFFADGDFGHSTLIERDLASGFAQGIRSFKDFADAVETAPELMTVFPDTSIGGQMRTIAEVIGANGPLGAQRQIFYATRGGFDTHSNQTNTLPAIISEVAEAVAAFRTAMIELGLWDSVTVFSASDFGRTTIDNGDGTDHGWGGHHFVAGGAVRGRRIYGDVPNADVTSQFYTERRGRLIPTISVEQYGATLGKWFGLNSAELASVFPNLTNFSTDDLGFL